MVRSGSVLLARRKPGGAIGGCWEFPGGKVNAAETAPQAVQRELHEELGVQCHVDEEVARAAFRNGPQCYLLQAYEVTLCSGRFRLSEHETVRWTPWSEIETLDLADSDRALLPQLLTRYGRQP